MRDHSKQCATRKDAISQSTSASCPAGVSATRPRVDELRTSEQRARFRRFRNGLGERRDALFVVVIGDVDPRRNWIGAPVVDRRYTEEIDRTIGRQRWIEPRGPRVAREHD